MGKTDFKDIAFDYMTLIEHHQEDLRRLDERIIVIANNNKQAKLLMTIPGIAELRAVEIIAEIGEIERFENASKLCSYAGLVPSIKQSGNTLRFGRLIQQSSKTLKGILIEASWNAIRTREGNQFSRFYKKLCKKKSKQQAICAVARKMCCVVYSMLKHKTEFMIL